MPAMAWSAAAGKRADAASAVAASSTGRINGAGRSTDRASTVLSPVGVAQQSALAASDHAGDWANAAAGSTTAQVSAIRTLLRAMMRLSEAQTLPAAPPPQAGTSRTQRDQAGGEPAIRIPAAGGPAVHDRMEGRFASGQSDAESQA